MVEADLDELSGELSLHAVTRSKTMNVDLRLKDAALTAQGEFTVSQTDFGIKLVSVAGGR